MTPEILVGALAAGAILVPLFALFRRRERGRILRDREESEARYQALLEVNARHSRVMAGRDSRFQALLEGTQEAIAALVKQRIALANPAAVRMFGYPSERHVRGALFSIFFAPEEGARLAAFRDAAASGVGEMEMFEAVGVRADGSRFDVEVKPTHIVLEGEDALQVTVRDVTDRKKASDALQVALRRQRALIDSIPDVIWMKDDQHRFIAANEALGRLVNLDPDAIIGKTDFDLFPAALANKFRAEDLAVLEQGQSLRVADEVIAPGGNLILFETVKTPIRGGDGRPLGTTGITRDITERKQMWEQLLQSQKMEAVGRLAGGIAHDFNNLLTTILGYCEFVRKQLAVADPIRDDLAEIERAGNQAASLTRQLLAFSRKQVVEPKPVDLNAIVTESSRMLRRLIGEDIQLTTRLGPGLGAVHADAGQMEQILMNLAVNSRDAMPRGGMLMIETRNVDFTEPDPSSAPPGRYVQLKVTDTGVGMDPDTLRTIFEPFFTTKEPGKGTGLGLSTVYAIVTQSGGEIRVSSEPGRGTIFRIFLPRLAPLKEAPPAPASIPVAREGTETILLVEDEAAVRRLIRRVLQDAGYRVLEAQDGDAAWALARAARGEIDLVLTDAVMPGMSGPELVERLTTEWPDVKVLLMSGYTGDAIAPHELLDGPAFLQKPFAFDLLSRKVREILDETSPRAVE